MSDEDTDFPTGDFIDLPPMDTEEGRDEALNYLMENDLPCSCSVIQEGEFMVLRIRYPEGHEELFDVKVQRSMELTQKDVGEQN